MLSQLELAFEGLLQVELSVQFHLRRRYIITDDILNTDSGELNAAIMGLFEDAHAEPCGTIGLQSVSRGRGLWQDEHTNLLTLISHQNVWSVGILSGIEHLCLKILGLIEIFLKDDLMFNTGVGEPLGQSLHDSLLEGVILGEVLVKADSQVQILALKT